MNQIYWMTTLSGVIIIFSYCGGSMSKSRDFYGFPRKFRQKSNRGLISAKFLHDDDVFFMYQNNPVPVPYTVPIKLEKQVPFVYKVPVPVIEIKPYPVKVYKNVPMPVHHLVPYPLVKNIGYPVSVPYKIPIPYRVPIPMLSPVTFQQKRRTRYDNLVNNLVQLRNDMRSTILKFARSLAK